MTNTDQVLPEGEDGAGGFVLNGYQYNGVMAKAMYLLTRPQGIRYKDLCRSLGWNRCRTRVKKDAARAGYVVVYVGVGDAKVMKIVPADKTKRPHMLNELEQIAVDHGLPSDLFSPEGGLRVWFHISPKGTEQAKKNLAASGMTLQGVLADATVTWCEPPKQVDAEAVRQRASANRDALARVSDLGIGKGIDADGVFRKVRMRGLDERRTRLSVERAEALSVAMRDFVKAAEAAGASSDDIRAALNGGGRSAKKLEERARHFDIAAGNTLLALSDARRAPKNGDEGTSAHHS